MQALYLNMMELSTVQLRYDSTVRETMSGWNKPLLVQLSATTCTGRSLA